MLVERKAHIEKEMQTMPIGYISKKTIKGKSQNYLQRREGNRIVGKYISADELEDMVAKIERRKTCAREILEIEERMVQLEEAARLIDKNLFCQLMVYKLSSGMDLLDADEKERCSSFGHAMNAIEGVPISKETHIQIEQWKNGEKTYLSVFESTLKRYGFPVEGRL